MGNDPSLESEIPRRIATVTTDMVLGPLERYIHEGTHPDVQKLVLMVRNHYHDQDQLNQIRDLAFHAAHQAEIRGEKVEGVLAGKPLSLLDVAFEAYKHGKLKINDKLTGKSLEEWEALSGPSGNAKEG